MEQSSDIGEWFLPGSEQGLSGRLIYGGPDKLIELEIYADSYLEGVSVINKTPRKDKRYHSDRYSRDQQRHHVFILGLTPGQMTLYNCQLAGVQKVGKDVFAIRYTVDFVFYGVHVLRIEDLLFTSGKFLFPYVSSWYDGDEFFDRSEAFGGQGFGEHPARELNPSIRIKKGVDLILIDSLADNGKIVRGQQEQIYQKFVKFQFDQPVSFRDLLQDAIIFKKLLEFSLGKPLKMMLNQMIMFTKAGNSADISVGNMSLHNGEEVNKHMQHQRYMLLSNWTLEQEELQKVLVKWYANESLYSIYDFYLDSNNWFQNTDTLLSNVMYNNRFLNIIQGLEAYYKKTQVKMPEDRRDYELEKKSFGIQKDKVLAILKKGNDAELTRWMNAEVNYRKPAPRLQPKLETVLSTIMISMQDILTPIFGQCKVVDDFPAYANKVRDELSHGLHLSTYQGSEMQLFFKFAQILLASCILASLEVQEIASKILHYTPFQEYIAEIRYIKPHQAV